MKQTLNKDTFRFLMNQIRPDNFSYEGQGILFDYLEQYEEETGEQIEFDPIAFCCEYTEADFNEVANDYLDDDIEEQLMEDCEGLDEEETAQKVAEYLSEKTTVLGITSDNQIIFQQF
jgi:hypothetical protein